MEVNHFLNNLSEKIKHKEISHKKFQKSKITKRVTKTKRQIEKHKGEHESNYGRKHIIKAFCDYVN